LLINENDIPFIDGLKHKTLNDFKDLKNGLKKEITATETVIVENAKNALNLIAEAGLEHNDFSGSYLPKHFTNLSDKKFEVNFEAAWQQDIENKTLYPKRVSSEVASTIEQIQPDLA